MLEWRVMQSAQDKKRCAVAGKTPLLSGGNEAWGKALCHAATTLTRDLSVEAVLNRLLAVLRHVARCDRGAVLLADGDEARVVRSFEAGERSPDSTEPFRFSVQQQRVLAQAAVERRPVLVLEATIEAARIPHQNTVGVLSHVTVPLIYDEALLGFAVIGSAQANAFSAQDIQGLVGVAALTAVALHNARLYESLQQDRDRLMALTNIDQQILAMSDSPQTVIRTVLRHAVKLLDAPKGLGVLPSDGEALTQVHMVGIGDPGGVRTLVQANWVRGRQLIETHGEGWILALDQAPSASETTPWFEGEQVQALLTIPLWLQGRLVGLIAIMDTHRRSWSEDDIHILRILASQATVAIDKAILAHRLRERLQASEEVVTQLQQLDQLKGQFIRNVSHELRTPLAIVKGYVDLIVDGVIDDGIFDQETNPGLAAAMGAIHTHTDNLIRIVETITTLGDADVGRLSLTPQPLHEICEAALRANWQQALRQHVSIVADLPADLPLVAADAQGLLRALNHVLENAIKFSQPETRPGEGPTVHFRAFERGAYVWIQVEDKGIGIPPDELGRIYDRFYQVHGESTRRYGGLGIGLALVKEVVERHHGEVVVESPGEGLGTTVSIKLPINQARPDSNSGVELAWQA
jgi:signal transduction histidine kinase